VGSLLVGLVIGLDLAGVFAGTSRAARFLRVAAALLLFGIVVGIAYRPAFDGYDTDLWTYLLVAERVADGQDVLHLDHFLLQPPASPHVSLVWVALGLVRRLTGLPAVLLVRGLGLLCVLFLSSAAWRLAGRLLPAALRYSAVVLFWLSLSETWGAAALGRYLALGFVMLAVETLFRPSDALSRPATSLQAALWIALAFYTHLFGGVLAVGAVVLVWIVRRDEPDAPRVARLSATLVLGLVLALPCLLYSLQTLGLRKSPAHLWRPDQLEVWGLRMLSPQTIIALVPWGVLALLLVGLLAPVPEVLVRARRLVRAGSALALVLLFTPLYQLGASVLGGWMMARVVFLAFPWIGAVVGLDWLRADGKGARPRRVVAAVLTVVAATQAIAREAAEWEDRRYEFRPEAQAEARALRDRLHGRAYVSLDMIGYATAALTLGRPLAVPPGQASPFGDFPQRQRRAHRALATNTPECWTALMTLYPDLEYLLTPGPDAQVERELWRERLGATTPEDVRATLQAMGALEPATAGRYFVLDALRRPETGAAEPRHGMGVGERCE
jgi:hypothetical protein